MKNKLWALWFFRVSYEVRRRCVTDCDGVGTKLNFSFSVSACAPAPVPAPVPVPVAARVLFPLLLLFFPFPLLGLVSPLSNMLFSLTISVNKANASCLLILREVPRRCYPTLCSAKPLILYRPSTDPLEITNRTTASIWHILPRTLDECGVLLGSWIFRRKW